MLGLPPSDLSGAAEKSTIALLVFLIAASNIIFVIITNITINSIGIFIVLIIFFHNYEYNHYQN